MNGTNGILHQHLINPVTCARCNSCVDVCTTNAISYAKNRYVVDPATCNGCSECLEVCPSGSIDHWRDVDAARPYSLEEQLTWPKLPPEQGSSTGAAGDGAKGAVAEDEVPFPPDSPLEVTVVEVRRLTASDAGSDIRHVVFDLGTADFSIIEGQSIGILPPPSLTNGEQAALRLYSIASQRDGENANGRHLALCVKRVEADPAGNPPGLCSNYLCDLQPGDRVKVSGPFGKHFLMPADEHAPLLLISTGTGVSPARAMIERRHAMNPAKRSGISLVYGARTPEEMPYLKELESLMPDFIDFNPAFSRQAGTPKKYVQDIVRENADKFARYLTDPVANIFLCGLKGMEEGIFDAFADICARQKLDWNEIHATLKEQHRLHIETY